MLATLAIALVLAALLFHSIARAHTRSVSVRCVSNLKQLQTAATLYSGENNDFMPPNGWASIEWSDGCPQGFQSAAGSWVLGEASLQSSDIGIRNGALFKYTGENPYIYHCPADKSKIDGSKKIYRKRSYSASYYMNGSKDTGYKQVKAKFSEIRDASTKFMYLDEHENTIDDGVFFLHLPGDAGEQVIARQTKGQFGGSHWMSAPGSRHSGGGNLSYIDGSVRWQRWHWAQRMLRTDANRAVANELDLTDMRWLQSGIPDVGIQWKVAAGENGPGHR